MSINNSFNPVGPTASEITETISMIVAKIDLIDINGNENAAVREGCKEAVEILTFNKRSYNEISESLVTDKGWVIALLAVDYLNGKFDGKLLGNIPIK